MFDAEARLITLAGECVQRHRRALALHAEAGDVATARDALDQAGAALQDHRWLMLELQAIRAEVAAEPAPVWMRTNKGKTIPTTHAMVLA